MSRIQILGGRAAEAVADNTLPTIGGNLAVVPDSETSSGFSLSWDKGSDNQDVESELKYLVYISTQDNITGVTSAESNGTLLNPNEQDQLDINTYQVSGQNAETQYWATVILKDQAGNKSAYSVVTTTTIATSQDGLDSRVGDEATLESLYTTLNEPALTGWSSNMDLSQTIEGITVETINSELRVTKIDLRNKGLTGNIEIDNWINLKECGYVNFFWNSLNTQIPQGLIDLPKNEYLYLCRGDTDDINEDPHEGAQTGGGDVHPGKGKLPEENVYTGAVPAPSDPSSLVLKWLILNWTDTDHKADNPDGISSIPVELFDIPTMVGMQVYVNANVSSMDFPQGITNMTNLDNFAFPGGYDYVNGVVPDIGVLSNVRFLRLDGSDFMTVNVDNISWEGMVEAQQISFTSNDITGTAVPAALFDGSMPNMFAIEMPFPADGVGVGGAFPEVAAGLNDGTGYKIVKFRRHSITSLPASLWNNSPAIIQLDFTHNELTTIGTRDLTNMGSLRYLRLSNNKLHEDAPNLDWENHLGQGIYLNNNNYIFKHLLYVPPWSNEVSSLPASGNYDREVVFNTTDETFYRWDADAEVWNDIGQVLLELYQSVTDAGDLEYASQNPFGTSRSYSTVDGNGDIVIDDFDAILEHTDNEYQWQKDGVNISDGAEYSGTNTKILTILDADGPDDGTYTLNVTNTLEASIGEGATFTSEDIIVELTQ